MLHELLPLFPKLEGNDSQLVLHSMAEFHSLEAKRQIEKRAKPGEYYKHQLIVSRIMYLKDRMFLIHEPGTGKSCTFTVTDESFKGNTNLFKRYYIVTYSSLIDSMRYQIICKCTNNKYIHDKGRLGASKKEVKMSGKDSFKDNYLLYSYDDLYKEVKGKTQKQLEEEFSYCVFNIDEVTKLVTINFTNVIKKDNQNGSITWIERIRKEILELATITNLDDPRIINSDIEYIQFWRLFHSVVNSKVIIASGTPMMNRASEFFILCNLLLPLDRQIDLELFANNIFYYNLKKFVPYLNGLISYVKSSNIVAKANYIGKRLNHKYIVETPADDISDFPQIITKEYDSQYNLYRVELFGYQAGKMFEYKSKVFSEQIATTTAQFICYVDCNNKTSVEANTDQRTLNYLVSPGISGLNTRMNSCALFSEIYRIELKSLIDARKEGKPGPGVSFNYLSLTDTGIGSLKKLFAGSGVFEVLEDFSFLKQIGGDYCNLGGITFRGLIKKPRVVFLTGGHESNASTRELIIQLAGSPDNIHGEYIQFIDGSSVMGIGVNVKNGKRFYRPIPEWNEAKDKQSRDRVFREDGHDEIREEMANEIATKTGVRPNPYELDVYVDVYNMCAYCRFFYIETKYVSKFIPSMKIDNNCPFVIENGKITIESIKGNGIPSMIVNSLNVVHLVGFCDRDTGKEIHYKQIMEYCQVGDLAHQKITEKTGIEISTDLFNLTLDQKDIIICISGVLYVSQFNEEVKSHLSNKVILYHNDCDFMGLYMNGNYYDECYAIVMKENKKDEESKLAKISSPAVIDVDYELIPVDMMYVSPSEQQYIQLEEKSFATRRILRIAKRFALDCVTNHERTYNTTDVDGSLECDYDTCEYTCSSSVLTDKSNEAYLYEGGGLFWSNYEILYSGMIIKECKDTIIKMFTNKDKITLTEIFDKLLPMCQREYFIKTAIYELISNREKLVDSFGLTAYICSSNKELFLTRDFPKTIKRETDNTGDYVKKLIGVTNNPDYRSFHSIDDDVINEIESINIDTQDPRYESLILAAIVDKMSKIRMYPSNIVLIERCFGRIAYNRTVNPQFRNPEYTEKPVDAFIAGDIFPIRCFVMVNPDGTQTFYHNQPEIKVMNEQGKISKIINVSDPIKVFHIQNGKPVWKRANKKEEEILKKNTVIEINKRIEQQLKKVIPIQMQDGSIVNYDFESLYYISYYEGVYRLTNKAKGTGRNFDNIDQADIIACLTWLKQSLLIYVPGNLQMIQQMENAISLSKKAERDNLFINFFRNNGLIFFYSLETLGNKKK